MHFVTLEGDETTEDLCATALNLSGRLERTRDRKVRSELLEDIDDLLDRINAKVKVLR